MKVGVKNMYIKVYMNEDENHDEQFVSFGVIRDSHIVQLRGRNGVLVDTTRYTVESIEYIPEFKDLKRYIHRGMVDFTNDPIVYSRTVGKSQYKKEEA